MNAINNATYRSEAQQSQILEMFDFENRRSPNGVEYVRARGLSANGKTVTICLFDGKGKAFEKAIMARTAPGHLPHDEGHIVEFRGQWTTRSPDREAFFRADGFDIFSGPSLEMRRIIFQLGKVYQQAEGLPSEQALGNFRSFVAELIPGIAPLRMDNVYPLRGEARDRVFGPSASGGARATDGGHQRAEGENDPWPPQFLRSPGG